MHQARLLAWKKITQTLYKYFKCKDPENLNIKRWGKNTRKTTINVAMLLPKKYNLRLGYQYIEKGEMTVIKGSTHQENTNLNLYAYINIPIPQRKLHEAKFQTISKCYRK